MIVDIIVSASQSNAFQTNDRLYDADILTQPLVPTCSVMMLNPTDDRWKISPRFSAGLDTRFLTYPYLGSRIWCAIPHAMVYRLRQLGHTPRLFSYAVGASPYQTDWKNTIGDQAATTLASALASRAYAALPAPDKRVLVTIHGESDVSSPGGYGADMVTCINKQLTAAGDLNMFTYIFQLNSACLGGGANVNTIRAAQANYVTTRGASKARLFDTSYQPLSVDQLHYLWANAKILGTDSANDMSANVLV